MRTIEIQYDLFRKNKLPGSGWTYSLDKINQRGWPGCINRTQANLRYSECNSEIVSKIRVLSIYAHESWFTFWWIQRFTFMTSLLFTISIPSKNRPKSKWHLTISWQKTLTKHNFRMSCYKCDLRLYRRRKKTQHLMINVHCSVGCVCRILI